MRVGTREDSTGTSRRLRDHPHACGDKSAKRCIIPSGLGSSPCVWGQEVADKVSVKSARIIPMRVGTRLYTAKQRAVERDHPHACGDK